MKATRIEHDIIIGVANGNVDGTELPDEVPVERLRVTGYNEEGDALLVDIENVSRFYIDDAGQKHLAQLMPEWQPLDCGWDVKLAYANGAWRARSGGDELAAAKGRGRALIADLAERQRQRYITAGEGKAAVYVIKREEVLRYQAASGSGQLISPSDYPWMNARASRLGVQLSVVAIEWAAKVQSWERVGRDIENAYEGAVEVLDALGDAAAVEADITKIIEGIRWP